MPHQAQPGTVRYRNWVSRAYCWRATPRPGGAGDPAELTLLLAQDRDRIAGALNDVVINRMFSAGLALETALGLLDGHRGAAGKVREALSELDLAIRDVRNVVFDHQRPESPSGGPPG